MTDGEPAAGSRLELEAGGARALVLPADGGRLGSLRVDGRELLVTGSPDGPIHWGSYPMAPWAGRIRHGRFAFDGRTHRLPLGLPPHAIHGLVYDRPWQVDGPDRISAELDGRWPFRGRVRQRFELDEGSLTVTLELEADEPMPAVVGWHPWFRRVLGAGDPPAVLRFRADQMLVRDGEGIPTGERVPPTAGPWDDAFTGVREDPELAWPGRLRLRIESSCPWWVVYSEPAHAICVEPQSGPPDGLNLAPEVVTPGRPLVHRMRWTWIRDDAYSPPSSSGGTR